MDEAVLASLDTVILARAFERVALVLVGALAVFLGYKLFRHMPTVHRSEGKLELPGGVSIFLTRIGPGAFFALFGCLMIGYSVTRPVSLTVPGSDEEVVYYSGIGQSGTSRPAPPEAALAGLEPEVAVGRLNSLLAEARGSLSKPEAEELAQAVRAAKFALMLSHWKPEWGDRATFERWVEESGGEDPPADLVPGATVVYRTVL